MKKVLMFNALLLAFFSFGQNVILNKVVKTNTNEDKFFYKINPEITNAEYLGELEVQGFSDDDVKVFGMIYKKAKEVGANAFSFQPFESLDGVAQKFDAAHYKVNLYYLNRESFPKEDNMVYLISSPYKAQTIALNDEKVTFQPRTYTKKMLENGHVFTISTRKLFGSSVKLSGQENQPMQFLQVSGFSVNSNGYGEAGIHIKSGDIIRLEQSYGQFLTMIYTEF